MAFTWTAPLPSNTVVAGDPGHPAMHNQLVDALTEVRDNVDTNNDAVLQGAAPTQADSTAVDVAGIVADFNTLLANLRTRGVLAP